MASVITELQQNALDPKFSVTDLVRKASVVARKLGAAEFQSWAEKELNGYPRADDHAHQQILAFNNGTILI